MARPTKVSNQSSDEKAHLSPSSDGRAASSENTCEIALIGKRRDGSKRFWCVRHHCAATEKYGRPAKICRNVRNIPIDRDKLLTLDLNEYAGGIALWGAAPPVYDTSILPLERGIHVHARPKIGAHKEIDSSYSAVRVTWTTVPSGGILVSEPAAVHYMTGCVFGVKMKHVTCSHCGHPHLDADWFSLHAHRTHLCGHCGSYFRDPGTSIGNPICGIRKALGLTTPPLRNSPQKLSLSQSDYPGGIQIWGSSPALMWTSSTPESKGIHVHAFKTNNGPPEIDETFSSVTIDGIKLDAQMVRVLMAQRTLPSLRTRIVTIKCPKCTAPIFDENELAYTPRAIHDCRKCGALFSAGGRIRKVIGNPLLEILRLLAKSAPRPQQHHQLTLVE